MARLKKQTYDKKYADKINKRFRDLGKRKIQFGVGIQKERFTDVLKQYGLGTSKGKLSVSKLNKLSAYEQQNAVRVLESFMENTTAKALKENLKSNKIKLRDTFLDYGVDIGKLSDEQYSYMWDKIHDLEREFSDGDYDAENIEIATGVIQSMLDEDFSQETVDELFDVLSAEDNAADAIDFLRTLQDNGFTF